MLKKTGLLCIIIPALLLLLQCTPGEDGPKGLGLGETPEMLYKSFRASSSQAYEGKAPEIAKDADLSPLFPTPGNQGTIGSCTAWTTAYACKTYQENIEREWGANTNKHIFSPSYIYNQINNGQDAGAPLEYALMLVIEDGCATLDTMPYTLNYREKPNTMAVREAQDYKAKSFARVDPKDLSAVKKMLSRGMPVLIGMMVYENFQFYSGGVYDKVSGQLLGGHAMCVVGYDESKKAFKIINSWSTSWGEQGYAWVGFDVFTEYVQVALVLYDEINASPVVPAVPVGVEASQGSYIDRIEVTWPKASNAESYEVYRSTNPIENFVKIADTRGTRYIDTKGIKKNTEYYYAIKSIARTKTSALSEAAKGYAGTLEKEIGIPQKLEGLYDSGAVFLSWNSMSGVDGYSVFRFDPKLENYIRIGSTKNAKYRDTETFTPGETMWYVIAAVRGTTEGKPGEALAVFISFPEPPEAKTWKAPRKLSASQGSFEDRIKLSWEKVADAPQYTVYRFKQDDETWTVLGETGKTEFEDTAPTRESEYYAVAVKDGNIIGERSESVSGYVKKNKPKDKKFDDDKYYDDRELEDTDYKNDDLYEDDKKDNKKKVVDKGFFDNEREVEAFFDSKEEQEKFFDSKEKQEKFFDSKEEQEKFFDSKEEQEKFFDSKEEQDKFFDSKKKQDDFFDSPAEKDSFFD
ncbi:MAG: hypothetical protein JW904_08745 [Spirochaetales bacterium]|nr:hypothetical protein [Spirochaetales bacterium]